MFSLINLIPNLQTFGEAAGSGAMVFELIERESKINIFKDEGEIPSKFAGDIEFRDVHFTYPSRKEAPVGHRWAHWNCAASYFFSVDSQWSLSENFVGQDSGALWTFRLW